MLQIFPLVYLPYPISIFARPKPLFSSPVISLIFNLSLASPFFLRFFLSFALTITQLLDFRSVKTCVNLLLKIRMINVFFRSCDAEISEDDAGNFYTVFKLSYISVLL